MLPETSFGKLSVGDKFHTGKSNGAGIKRDQIMWQEYQKVDKSHAVCTGQFGYGNTRQVGSKFSFGANKPVFKI